MNFDATRQGVVNDLFSLYVLPDSPPPTPVDTFDSHLLRSQPPQSPPLPSPPAANQAPLASNASLPGTPREPSRPDSTEAQDLNVRGPNRDGYSPVKNGRNLHQDEPLADSTSISAAASHEVPEDPDMQLDEANSEVEVSESSPRANSTVRTRRGARSRIAAKKSGNGIPSRSAETDRSRDPKPAVDVKDATQRNHSSDASTAQAEKGDAEDDLIPADASTAIVATAGRQPSPAIEPRSESPAVESLASGSVSDVDSQNAPSAGAEARTGTIAINLNASIPVEQHSIRVGQAGSDAKSADNSSESSLVPVTPQPVERGSAELLNRLESEEAGSGSVSPAPTSAVDGTLGRGSSSPDASVPGAGSSSLRFAQHLVARPGERVARTSPITEVEQARLVERVARAFRSAEERGGNITLRLHPPELGALRVELRVEEGALSARLEAETPAARGVLLDNSQILRDRLAELGVRVERFDVDLLDRRSAGDTSTFEQGRPRDQEPPRSPRTPERPVESLESARIASHPRTTTPGRLNVIV